jgi:hypothetical protein
VEDRLASKAEHERDPEAGTEHPDEVRIGTRVPMTRDLVQRAGDAEITAAVDTEKQLATVVDRREECLVRVVAPWRRCKDVTFRTRRRRTGISPPDEQVGCDATGTRLPRLPASTESHFAVDVQAMQLVAP